MADLIGEGRKSRIAFLFRVGCLGAIIVASLGYSAYVLLSKPKAIEYYIPPAPIALDGQHYCYSQFKSNAAVWYVLDFRHSKDTSPQQGILLRGIADIRRVGIASISGTIGRDNLIQLLMQQEIKTATPIPFIGDIGFDFPGMSKTDIREFNFYGKYTVADSDIRIDGLVYNLKDGKPVGDPGSFHCSTVFPEKDWGT
jgi:hypothetical protein